MAMTDTAPPPTRPADKRSLGLRARRWLTHGGIFLTLIVLWEIGSRSGFLDPLFYPRPTAILRSFWRIYVQNSNIWRHLYVPLGLVFAGFVTGSVLGAGLGAIVGFNPTVRRFLQPYVIVLKVTPRIAVALLLIAALGFGARSKIAIIMLVCFFAPFINTLSGVMNVPNDKLELFRSLSASNRQIFVKLRMPASLPLLFAGMKIGLTTALIGAVVAEFAQATDEVGVLVSRFSFQLDMAASIAALLGMTVIGLILFYSMEILDDRMVFWRRDAPMTAT